MIPISYISVIYPNMLSKIDADFWLADEIWLKVFLNLSSRAALIMMAVSNRFYSIGLDKQIWQTYLLRDFGLDKKIQLSLLAILNIHGQRAFNKIYQLLYHLPRKERVSLMTMINDTTLEQEFRYKLISQQMQDIANVNVSKANVLHYFQKRKHTRFLKFIFEIMIAQACSIEDRLKYEIHCYQPLSVSKEVLRNRLINPKEFFISLLEAATASGNLKALFHLIKIAKEYNNTPKILEISVLFRPICLAASRGYKSIVHRIYKVLSKDNEDHQDVFWSKVLELAAKHGHTKIVHMLLHHGKHHFAKGNTIGPALLQACCEGHLPIAKLLIAAKKEAIDFKVIYTPLMCAAIHGHYPIVEFLLMKGANIDIRSDSWSTDSENALVFAVKYGHRKIVQLLLSYGATARGLEAYHEALEKRHFKIAKDLIYDLPSDIIKQKDLFTCLLGRKQQKLIELVIACQGNIKFKYCKGAWNRLFRDTETPLDYAYKVKPKLIDSIFKGIARLKLGDARIALNKVHIHLLAQLLRFIHECEIKYSMRTKSSSPTLFTPSNFSLTYNRYALNAAQALLNVMLEYAPATTLDSFLLLIRGNHPILTPIYLSLQDHKNANTCNVDSISATPRLT